MDGSGRFAAANDPVFRKVGRVCEWFALCDNLAAGTVDHPVLGEVPTCQRCADKLNLLLVETGSVHYNEGMESNQVPNTPQELMDFLEEGRVISLSDLRKGTAVRHLTAMVRDGLIIVSNGNVYPNEAM